MKSSVLRKGLIAVPVVIGFSAALLLLLIIPEWGRELAGLYPEYGYLYWHYLIWAWVTALPCFAALILFGLICEEDARKNFFCPQNGRRFTLMSRLLLADTGLFTLVCIVFFILRVLHIGFALGGIFVIIGGLSLSALAAAAARWVREGCALQEENTLLRQRARFSKPTDNA